MALQHRREPEGLVLLCVLLRADAEEAAIEQACCAREHALARDLAQAQVLGGDSAEVRELAGEVDHLVELLLVAPQTPLRVVDVLPPPSRVGAHRLDVAHRVRADPDVLPGRRDDEFADALEDLGLFDPLAVLVQVLEPSPAPATGEPGPRTVRFASAFAMPPFFPTWWPSNRRGCRVLGDLLHARDHPAGDQAPLPAVSLRCPWMLRSRGRFGAAECLPLRAGAPDGRSLLPRRLGRRRATPGVSYAEAMVVSRGDARTAPASPSASARRAPEGSLLFQLRGPSIGRDLSSTGPLLAAYNREKTRVSRSSPTPRGGGSGRERPGTSRVAVCVNDDSGSRSSLPREASAGAELVPHETKAAELRLAESRARSARRSRGDMTASGGARRLRRLQEGAQVASTT